MRQAPLLIAAFSSDSANLPRLGGSAAPTNGRPRQRRKRTTTTQAQYHCHVYLPRFKIPQCDEHSSDPSHHQTTTANQRNTTKPGIPSTTPIKSNPHRIQRVAANQSKPPQIPSNNSIYKATRTGNRDIAYGRPPDERILAGEH